MIKKETMIESIIIKNKKGDKIELTLEELQELKEELNGLDQVQAQPYPTFYPHLSPNPWKFGEIMCKAGSGD